MLKKILLGTAIAVVFSTASYAQIPTPPEYFQAWFTRAQTLFNQVKDEKCYNGNVAFAFAQMQSDQLEMGSWISLATTRTLAPIGQI